MWKSIRLPLFYKNSKNHLTYYQKDNIITTTRDIIKKIITKTGGHKYEKDIDCSRYAEGFY